MYLTLAPPEGVGHDEGFAERLRLQTGVNQATFIQDIGGGTNFDPLEFDIDLTADDGQGVLWAFRFLLEAMEQGWSARRVTVLPADRLDHPFGKGGE
jgi:hypothetical protein